MTTATRKPKENAKEQVGEEGDSNLEEVKESVKGKKHFRFLLLPTARKGDVVI